MKSIGRVVSCAGALCLVAGQAWAADGVLIVQKITTAGGAPQTHQIQIEAHRMRAEVAGVGGRSQVIVFDGTHDVMMMIDDTNKTYSEITKADVEALSSQMSAAMSQMQDQLKNLPPEQRAQIEAMMRGRGMPGARGAGAAAPPKMQYKKTGTDHVGKWTCDKYEGFTDGEKKQDLCTVDPKVLGLSMADFAVTKDVANFFQKLMPGNAAQMFRVGSMEDQGFSGVPVRSVTTVGTGSVTSEIADVQRQSFPDTLFQAPAGYEKRPSPFTGRGRGRQ
jgi:hypothetical protein